MGLHPLSISFCQFSYVIIQAWGLEEGRREGERQRERWDRGRKKELFLQVSGSWDTSVPLSEHEPQHEPKSDVLQWVSDPISFSGSLVSDSLQPRGLQHARLPCFHHLPELALGNSHNMSILLHWVCNSHNMSILSHWVPSVTLAFNETFFRETVAL